jgi:hypothetical protein
MLATFSAPPNFKSLSRSGSPFLLSLPAIIGHMYRQAYYKGALVNMSTPK